MALLGYAAMSATAVEIGPLTYETDSPVAGEATVTGLSSAYTSAINRLVIPDELTIDSQTFKVTTIAPAAFISKTLSENIEISGNVATIGVSAFNNTSNVRNVVIRDGALTLLGASFLGSTIESIKLPRELEEIGANAFVNCHKLTDIDLEDVHTIGTSAFFNCESLKSIVIPASTICIEPLAFNKVERVYFKANTPVLYHNAFPEGVTYVMEGPWLPAVKPLHESKIPKSGTVYVPEGSEKMYTSSFLMKWGDDLKSYTDEDGVVWTNHFWKNMTVIPYDNSVELTITGNGRVYQREGSGFNMWEFKTGDKIMSYDKLFVAPDEGYQLTGVVIDGMPTDGAPAEILSSIDFLENETVELIFEESRVWNNPENAFVTVKGSDVATHTHKYPKGHQAVIDVTPEDGWAIHSVKYNGQVVTDKLVGNTYTTPSLEGNNLLEIILQETQVTGLAGVVSDGAIHIQTADGHAYVTGDTDGHIIEVFTLSGRKVYSGYATDIPLAAGTYLLSVNGKSFKFVI